IEASFNILYNDSEVILSQNIYLGTLLSLFAYQIHMKASPNILYNNSKEAFIPYMAGYIPEYISSSTISRYISTKGWSFSIILYNIFEKDYPKYPNIP
ncbi:6029_t:CDS:1, partial [Dentiscutata heterogama]